jgi:hypothetical protein
MTEPQAFQIFKVLVDLVDYMQSGRYNVGRHILEVRARTTVSSLTY